ncbi:hypothetical protein H6F86_03865 [Phormidium sp. FACHB-592]|uniref:Uncharacterized protein n=1 Tax=Stenomitos frigidus AS-A4 TaxID=2933935 RepID=A0ABV0KQK0_9CYAN|nr:hypothetical protein [Phormidium sp. FACHB-592]MBD2073036.1 hypothetical protein [Phormidium sp. FACHB-592]
MKFFNSSKQVVGVLLLATWLWLALLPSSVALANESFQLASTQGDVTTDIDYNWSEIDQQLVNSLNDVSQSTEEFVSRELDHWTQKRIDRVEHPFLDWYFNFLHQKATEFGVPFAWMAFKLDSQLKIFQTKEEKAEQLNTNQILQRRMEEDINRKFAEVVLNREAMADLKDVIDRTAENYASAVGVKFSSIKSRYQVADQDWERHLDNLSQIVANTGTEGLGLSGSALTGSLTTKVLAVTAASAGTKVVTGLVAKSSSKLLAKGGAAIAAKWGSTLVDPALGIGLIVWDVWSYRRNVDHDRPLLKQDLIRYITALRDSIQENQEGNGIMDAIASLQMDLIKGLHPRYG